MRIAIGADHAGFLLKEHLKATLRLLGHTVDDHGTDSEVPIDYPPICLAVAKEVAQGRAGRGIVLGGSGQGEQIVANKVAGIRAALCNDLYVARLSRAHNDANVIALGARLTSEADAAAIVRTFLETAFQGGRHADRLEKIRGLEGG